MFTKERRHRHSRALVYRQYSSVVDTLLSLWIKRATKSPLMRWRAHWRSGHVVQALFFLFLPVFVAGFMLLYGGIWAFTKE